MNGGRQPESRGGGPDSGVRRALLDAAHGYAQQGKTYLAIDRYLKLIREHPHSLEGREAGRALLSIAQRYEAKGKRYHALSVYDKVAAWQAARRSPGGEDGSPVLDESTHTTKADHGRNRQRMDEVPFVDLAEDVHITQNFERLGRVHRMRAEILRQAVDFLTKLKE